MAETFTLELTRDEIAEYLVGKAVVHASENVPLIRQHGAKVWLAARPETGWLLEHHVTFLTDAMDDPDTQEDAVALEESARAAREGTDSPWSD